MHPKTGRHLHTYVWTTASALLLIFATVTSAQTAPSPATPKDDEPIVLDRFETVGSRIKRLDTQTVSPVTVIQSSDLRNAGFQTIAEAVRSLPFNSGDALTPTDGGTSFTPGVNSFNIRGLGNNNTLVLVNGRRAVPYAVPGYDGFQTVFDLNSIPDAAIESVEILKDGGSALYGSDAVAGVINFKLKKDYQGVHTSMEVGNYFTTDGFSKKLAIIAGTSNGKTSVLFALSLATQEAVYARDLSYSRTADKTELAHRADPRYEFATPGGRDTWAQYGPITDPATDAADWGWFDLRSSFGYPGRVTVDADGDGEADGTYTFASPTNNPTVANAEEGTNYYNYQSAANLTPWTRDGSFFTTLHHEFTPDLYGKAEISFTRSESMSDAAPTPIDLASEHGLDTASVMTIPSYNAYNPWGVDIISGRRRLVEAGNRVNDVTSDTPRLLVALGGNLPASELFTDWVWEVGATYSKNQITNQNHNSVTDYKMQQALNGLTADGKGNLTWNPNTPLADRTYFNWFGLNDSAFARFLTSDNPTSASLEYQTLDFQSSGTLFQLPAGPLGLAIGGERRNEKLAVVVSDLNESGNIIGGGQSSSSFGSRQVSSLYAEISVPVFKWLELLAAGRFEKYSDKDFQERIRPKVGIKIRPLDWLVLRGSYSESFKAPDLAYLYSGGTTSFTSSQYVDPLAGGKDQIQIRTSGDPTLRPETTDTYFAGFSIEPSRGWLSGFSFSADYFHMKQKNLLAQLTDFYSYGDFLENAMAGDPVFASRVIRDPITSQLLYIADDYSNLGTADYKGWDLEAAYAFSTRIGRFRISTAGTYINNYTVNEDELAGGWLNARFNGNAGLSWTFKHWGANLHAIYRGIRHADINIGPIETMDDDMTIFYDVKPQITLNASLSYDALWGAKVTVGVNNLLDTDPPTDLVDGTGTTSGINTVQPSFWYTRIEKDF